MLDHDSPISITTLAALCQCRGAAHRAAGWPVGGYSVMVRGAKPKRN